MASKDPNESQLRVPAGCRPTTRDRDQREITESIEEYTEGIYRLQQELSVVGTGDVSRYMTVSPASATAMLKKLAELRLVEHTPYHGVRLTADGTRLSLSLLRRHRLVECLLVNFLELPWDDVHELACKLEHYLSEEVADRIERALGYPTTCPHGNPVDASVEDLTRPLADCVAGEVVIISRITDERTEFLGYLLEIGLVPQTEARIESKSPFGDVITLRLPGLDSLIAVGREVSSSIRVVSPIRYSNPLSVVAGSVNNQSVEFVTTPAVTA